MVTKRAMSKADLERRFMGAYSAIARPQSKSRALQSVAVAVAVLPFRSMGPLRHLLLTPILAFLVACAGACTQGEGPSAVEAVTDAEVAQSDAPDGGQPEAADVSDAVGAADSGDLQEDALIPTDSEAPAPIGDDANAEVLPAGPSCGDGDIDEGEVCDDGEDNGAYGHCRADCSAMGPYCGDGIVDATEGEVCDDGVNDALAGGCLPGCEKEDLSDEVFDDPLLMIDITLSAEDWEALRHQRKTRHGMFGKPNCRNELIENPYTWFKGTVTINGTTITETGLRKKGHLGSQSTLKPSIKVKFHEFVSGQNYKTLKRFALNNGKNDKSYLRTCFAYRIFAAAGIPAPRCTRAHVTVNGVAMGPYVAVEEYKNPFMRRHFSDITGNLYEGTACDWRPEFFGGFEQETNLTTDPSKSDLQAVMSLMEVASDTGFELALGELFDLDKLYRFWAVESLIWHRDGYSGNANNYMVYADPALQGRFVFLPWGPDGAFNPDNRAAVPDSVLAFGALVHRLYMTEAGRTRFYEELFILLDTIWDPEVMVAEAEAVRELLSPHLLAHEEAVFDSDITGVQQSITNRRAVIEEVLADGQPEWTVGMRTQPCTVPTAEVSGSFETTWATLSDNIWSSGSGSVSLTLGGETVTVTGSGARAGWKNTFSGRAQLHLNTDDNRRIKFTFNFPDTRYFDPFLILGPQPLIRPPLTANMVVQDLSGQAPNVVYELGEGTWSFTQVGEEPGDPVSVDFDGTLYLPVGS